ncbi:MAG: hypothetical protein CL799_03005 [Chromatiales bacterium]|nr:hypothetical protein [Chromatiales bacterium]
MVDGRVAEEGRVLAQAEIAVPGASTECGDIRVAEDKVIGASQIQLVVDNVGGCRAANGDGLASRLVLETDCLDGNAAVAVKVAVHDESYVMIAEVVCIPHGREAIAHATDEGLRLVNAFLD